MTTTSKKPVILKTILLLIIAIALAVIVLGFYLFSKQSTFSSIPPDLGAQAGYQVINRFPHDPQAFTQGLVYHEGEFYESTGLYGQSSLRKVALESGSVLEILPIPEPYFAEGLTLWEDNLIQITWKEGVGFVYNLADFQPKLTFTYESEGWGITHDGNNLIMSDGTSTLYFLDPVTFEVVREVSVTLDNVPVTNINELEYILGEVYANIWLTNTIMRIDPSSGKVLGTIDLAGLLAGDPGFENADVLNGIAYDAKTDRLFVTGKFWPWVFEIKLINK